MEDERHRILCFLKPFYEEKHAPYGCCRCGGNGIIGAKRSKRRRAKTTAAAQATGGKNEGRSSTAAAAVGTAPTRCTTATARS